MSVNLVVVEKKPCNRQTKIVSGNKEIDTHAAAGAAASAPIQLLFFCLNLLPGRFPTQLLCFVPFVAYALGASFHFVFFKFFGAFAYQCFSPKQKNSDFSRNHKAF